MLKRGGGVWGGENCIANKSMSEGFDTNASAESVPVEIPSSLDLDYLDQALASDTATKGMGLPIQWDPLPLSRWYH